MRHVYLVRHTEYDSPLKIAPGRLPFPLSKIGRDQAIRLQKFFQDKAVDIIYSSAVLRCQETAEIIAHQQVPIHYDRRLLETHSSYQGFWYDQKMDWSHFFGHRAELGGEGAADILERVSDFWTKIVINGNQNSNLILCSHGDVLYCLNRFLHGVRQMEDQDLYEFDDTNYQPKGSIQEILIDERQTIEIKAIIKPS